ncbi:MAG TPA: adenylate/guanylate cyclase domain-containing protein, partial [Candidatus Wallbacteria bacterium]|nr:adenylate/guanylate cyclase domain-containing protein [Candidatus Wallbacteria bacterium]
LHDDFATPMMLKTKLTMPGVMIHALAQATFLENAFIYKVSNFFNFALTILLSVFLGAVIARKTPFKAFVTAVLLMLAHLLATGVLFYFQIAVHSVLPQLSMILTYVFMTSYKYLKEENEKQLIKSIFKQYVTAEVVDELLESPEKLALGGKKTKLTVLFLDIRNFTRLSEQLTPEAVVDLLNSFFEEMVAIVFKYDGTLDKYLGDGMMVIFGAPADRPDNARRAVECALEMQRASIEFSRRRRAANIYTIDGIGVGVNTGEVVVGNIGSQKHKEYTIIGDNVNLAARIVSIALVNQVLVSESTYLELASKLEVKKKETVKLKGKTEPVNVYEIVRIN